MLNQKQVAKRKRLRKWNRLLNKFSAFLKRSDPKRWYLWNDPRENRRKFLKCNKREGL